MVSTLRIGILAPLKRPITPGVTASRPRVILDLVRGLSARGHEVSVFGTGDSDIPGAKVVPVVPRALVHLALPENPFYRDAAAITRAIMTLVDKAGEFDILHNHMYPEFLPLLALDSLKTPMVTTVHAQMTDDMKAALASFPRAHLVAISHEAATVAGFPMTVIHNGIDTDLFEPDPARSRDYLLFVGRMSKAKRKDGSFMDPKGVANAIAVAEAIGEKLKIVGNVEDSAFFDTIVRPHLSDMITFVGKVSSEQLLTREEMVSLYQGAKALLNPINWEEPFGLVMAEALSCGTPVVAYNRGSVSEILVDSKVGFVVDPGEGIDGIARAVQKLDTIDRAACRDHAVSNFSIPHMVDGYERLYDEVVRKTPADST